DGFLRQSSESPAFSRAREARRLAARRSDLLHRSARSPKSHGRDLGEDPECSLLRATTAEVQTNRPMHAAQLLLGETFPAQCVEAVLIRLAASDRADVADRLAKHPAQRRQVELRVVSEDYHI